MRIKITKYSLKKAAIRIEKSRIHQLKINPIEEEELMEKAMESFNNFESTMC